MRYWITNATLEHAPSIAELTAELGYPANITDTQHWLEALLDSPDHSVLLAASDTQLYGWLVVEKRLTLEAGYKAEITGLVVSAKCRRMGVGQALVSAAEGWAAEQGLNRLVVRSNIARAESHDFYQSIGFVRKKTAHVYEKGVEPV